MKLIYIRESRFELVGKLSKGKSNAHSFTIVISATPLDHALVMPIHPMIKTWAEAAKAARDLLWIVEACLSYSVDGKIELPADLEHIAPQVPHYVRFLISEPNMFSNN